MGATDIILQLAEKNNGIVTTSMVTAAGISRGNLNYLVDMGKLEKTSRGVYILPEAWEDEFINLQSRFKRGVFSHETALFLYDLTDRTPNHYDMTFPSHYNLTSAKKENVRCTQVTEPLYEIGIELAYTPNGNTVHAYNPERTLCDILRPRSHVDIQIVAEAFKSYTKQKNKNIPRLSEYARLFKVEERLRHYLEVLL
ncbi:MAG: type IV toxin-antitoxin system AbiEi family antitoxin domain-containing protein [Hungatella hathewayi]|nr:type IV toxin-antitoxin system AbiEi family antitoxin domain-containing protein [Hungatella hathewayi]